MMLYVLGLEGDDEKPAEEDPLAFALSPDQQPTPAPAAPAAMALGDAAAPASTPDAAAAVPTAGPETAADAPAAAAPRRKRIVEDSEDAMDTAEK
jgi:hypothetical protein